MYHWRDLVPLIFPMWAFSRNIVRGCRKFRQYRLLGRLRLWFVKRLSDAAAFALSVWAINRMCRPAIELIEVVWPGPFFLIRVLLESYLATGAVHGLIKSTYYLLWYPAELPSDMVHLFWLASVLSFWYPIAANVILSFLALWSIILLLETILDEFFALVHTFDRPPVIIPTADWELAAVLRPSNNGYGSRQFYAAKVADFNRLDDPFWTDHASAVCLVEVRRRNMIWKTITIWQVSLLNGGKKKLQEFNHISRLSDNLGRDSSTAALCFQSEGVVFVYFLVDGSNDLLFLYDVRHRKSATFILKNEFWRQRVISIRCQRRSFNADGSVAGWRIRCLAYSMTRCYCHPEDLSFRPRLENTIFDLREKSELVSHEEIIFARCLPFWRQKGRFVRTSGGSFGRYQESAGDGPTMMYDDSSSGYSFFPNFNALLRSDKSFALYNYTPSPTGSWRAGDDYGNLCPAVLTSRECIECFENGTIFRTEFAPSTLKYLAAKALFRARPNLRNEMSAGEFRELTGIGGMESHFDR